MQKVIYTPSTPLNILVSVALASYKTNRENAYIWLIDQYDVNHNIYYDVLTEWNETPFLTVDIFSHKSGIDKFRGRRKQFSQMESLLKGIVPDVIATGSDRRIEFQFSMMCMEKLGHSPLGCYLDDGLYSYLGRDKRPISDLVNLLIKKIFYGFWWQEPESVGVSNWVSQCFLFTPQYAYEGLKLKQLKQLDCNVFKNELVIAFSQRIIQKFNVNVRFLETSDYIVLLPHPSNYMQVEDYQKSIYEFVQALSSSGNQVSVKYHPRELSYDSIELSSLSNVRVMPSGVAFEFLLPLIKENATIVGDFSTALLTSRWLRKDVSIIANVSMAPLSKSNRLLKLFEKNNISLVSSFQAILDGRK